MRRRKGKKSKRPGRVPLEVLEKRLRKLSNVVRKRGGYLPGDV